MKKRNWTLLCLMGGLMCFGVFGVYNVMAKDNGTFELEDMAGDRAYLSDFPLEGYGGDHVNSMEFTIIDGKLDVAYHSYNTEALKNIRTGREIGQSEWMSYFSHAWNSDGSYCDTEAVPSSGAEMEYSPEPSIHLFEEFPEKYRYGETIKVDEIDIFGEVRAEFGKDRFISRYPTGLSMKEPVVFTHGATAKNGGNTSAYMNSYNQGFVGEEYDIRVLDSYSAEVGETVFAVTIPDERCVGETYIYKVSPEKVGPNRYKEETLEEHITDRTTKGTVEPFLPVPDPKEKCIVGLEGIGEKYLAVFLTVGQNFITEIYNMEGNLIGSAQITLVSAIDDEENRVVKQYLRANEIDLFYVEYEEGTSFSIKVTDRVVFESNHDDGEYYYDDTSDTVTGRMLLWITEDGVEQSEYQEASAVAAVRGDKILLINHAIAPEKEELSEIIGISTRETWMITVLDGETFDVLYEGILKNDFWQDDFKQLTKIDSAGGNAYIVKHSDYSVGALDGNRSIVELKPIGGRSGDIW